LWIPWDMSSCTSEEQVTLHIENCVGCAHFHKWKFKWTFFEVPRDFTCSFYSFFVWPVTCRWHVPSEITCKWHVPSDITCENQNSSHEFFLLVSLILCYVNLLFTLVIAFLKPLSGSSESLANAPDKIYDHMFKKYVLFVYLHIYLLELCFTLCRIFIAAKHFIIYFRLTTSSS